MSSRIQHIARPMISRGPTGRFWMKRLSPAIRGLAAAGVLIAIVSSPRADANGTLIRGGATDIHDIATLQDGLGGSFMVWAENRASVTAGYDIYAAHVNASLNVITPPGVVVVCNATGNQRVPKIVTDNAGGFFVAWKDDGQAGGPFVFMQRVKADLTIPTTWPANGQNILPTVTPVDNPKSFDLAPDGSTFGADGSGAAVVVSRVCCTEIRARRATGDGSLGMPSVVATNLGFESPVAVVADGAGGTFFGYQLGRVAFIQHADATGQMWPSATKLNIGTHPAQEREDPALVSDGNGGVFAAFADNILSDGG